MKTFEAIQWLGEKSFDDLYNFAGANPEHRTVGMFNGRSDIAQIRTLKGIINIIPNEWIFKDVNGNLFKGNINNI